MSADTVNFNKSHIMEVTHGLMTLRVILDRFKETKKMPIANTFWLYNILQKLQILCLLFTKLS